MAFCFIIFFFVIFCSYSHNVPRLSLDKEADEVPQWHWLPPHESPLRRHQPARLESQRTAAGPFSCSEPWSTQKKGFLMPIGQEVGPELVVPFEPVWQSPVDRAVQWGPIPSRHLPLRWLNFRRVNYQWPVRRVRHCRLARTTPRNLVEKTFRLN